ncbi:hypothetical protein MLD38_015909 [Melastoma candidum]|uniref:Uncharacterized protein n=1 Tax=Melastoma candidum TaxID=119954 RepID=A0ACB9RHW3_9MYRT|nr:hypothetical protein MLD38_015909 [Melastoma candidum]
MVTKRGRGQAAPKAPRCKGGSISAPQGGESWVERLVRVFYKGDPYCPDADSMRKYLMRTCYPPAVQIHLHLLSLYRLKFLSLSFPLPFSMDSYKLIVEAVGRFVFEGKIVMADLKNHIDRWDPNFKEGAVAAKLFAGLANLLGLKEVSSWALELEDACLHPASPVAIYTTYEKLHIFYVRARLQLWLLIFSAKAAIQQASTAPVAHPPPAPVGDTPAPVVE